jgi:hypothetical protein
MTEEKVTQPTKADMEEITRRVSGRLKHWAVSDDVVRRRFVPSETAPQQYVEVPSKTR